MALSFRSSKRGRDVIDVWEAAAAHIDRPRAIGSGRFARLVHRREPPSQGLIHELFERRVELATQLLNAGGNVIVE
ncbi:MAG: hypothetical protein RLZZ326_1148 [Planctomycetota bacterium]|jgi:hypothetical protein